MLPALTKLRQQICCIPALPNEVQPIARGWLSCSFMLAVATLCGTSWANAGSQDASPFEKTVNADSDRESEKATVATKSTAVTPKDLKSLIDRIRENEALYRNLDATVKRSWLFEEVKEEAQVGGFSAGPSVLKSIHHVDRVVTQGDRFHFVRTEYVGLTTGRKFSQKQQFVFDGKQTVAIAAKNTAAIFRKRHEPAEMISPHSWGMFTLRVSFPLSTYLSGTDAIKAHHKGPRNPRERGDVFEFNRVEAEFIGAENVEDLDCVKVKVKRWYYTRSPPSIQYLWLARDRNYHIAQVRTASTRNGKEVPGEGSRVTKWQEVAKDIWLPTAVVSVAPKPNNANQRPSRSKRTLHVDSIRINPELPADFFQLPEVPSSLPKFVIGNDGLFKESPQQPTPVKADAGTTLGTILNRLAVEEAKYGTLEINTTESYQHLNRSNMMSSGLYLATESRERSIVAGKQMFYQERQARQLAGSQQNSSIRSQAYDGRQLRGYTESHRGTDPPKVQRYGSLALGEPDNVPVVRAHNSLFHNERSIQSLSQYLKSGWSDYRNRYNMVVEYVGDEQIAGLHCHKLKCNVNVRKNSTTNGYFLLWLARDRNLIPIRHEWRSPTWFGKLPTGIKFVHDLRQIQPGIWFPYKTTHLAFRRIGPFPDSANLPLLQWRRDLQVESLTWNPEVDDALFSRLKVPANTKVSVRDEHNNYLGQYEQTESGNITISPEKLLQLRQKARVRDDEAKRRQAALDALIGKPAPPLPPTTWLNSQRLTWKELQGKVVVIDFWAIWCGPCAPDLKRLANIHRLRQDNGVTNQVLIGIHTAGSDRDKIEKVIADKKLSYPIIIDAPPKAGRAAWGALFDAFAVHAIPLAIVVDGSGNVAAHGRLEEMLSKASQLAKDSQTK